MEFLTIEELQQQARERLTQSAYDYYASGAEDELTLAENQAAFDRIPIHYRVLVDVARRSTETTLFGTQLRSPVLIAPTAFHELADPEGELAAARAAQAFGTIMVLSSLSSRPLEQVVAQAPGRVWFQLYVVRDRGLTRAVVERAARAGCRALVLTVDAPLLGNRRRDVRNRFRLPEGMVLANLSQEPLPASQTDSALANYFNLELDSGLSWKDLEWLASLSELPVLIKGVVRADDARRAVDHGAAGVIVSNHGGRQLDTSVATIEALPRVVEAAGDELTVLMDGGIRRGTDIVKALCRGARAVLVGRPILWGLAAGGQSGVESVLQFYSSQLDRAMALCGAADLAALDAGLLRG